MSLDELKAEIAALSPEQQRQLAAYLVHLRHEQNAETQAELARRIDDRTPGNWLSLNELKEKWKE